MEYYIASGQQRLGPFTIDNLAARNIHPDTLVWHEGMPQWAPASTVPELQPILQQQQTMGSGPISYGSPTPGGYVPQPAQFEQSNPGSPINYAGPGQIGYATPGNNIPPFIPGQSNRVLAGVLGIFLGAFGVHKFVAGLTTGGVIMLCITLGSVFVAKLCCFLIFSPMVMAIIGVVEGIMYLCCTDEEFYVKYTVQKQQWF